jgi:hypothetical protein
VGSSGFLKLFPVVAAIIAFLLFILKLLQRVLLNRPMSRFSVTVCPGTMFQADVAENLCFCGSVFPVELKKQCCWIRSVIWKKSSNLRFYNSELHQNIVLLVPYFALSQHPSLFTFIRTDLVVGWCKD